jgi:hypothetical protein
MTRPDEIVVAAPSGEPLALVMHLRMMHCVWTTATTPFEELFECHQAFTDQPTAGHVPHQHRTYQEPPTTEHGFW